MSSIPSLSSSISTAFSAGFARLDSAAADFNSLAQAPDPAASPAATVDLSSSVPADPQAVVDPGAAGIDPLVAGVTDLMLSNVQVGAAAVLLHTYDRDRQQLFDMLKP